MSTCALICPSCGSNSIKLNGHIHNGKQNHLCKDCKRQFVEEPTKKYISAAQRTMIDRLLLERISLAGICRVMEISKVWLLDYVSSLYAGLPDDLNAVQAPVDIQGYLDENMDKIVYELLPLKKTLQQLSLKHHQKILRHLQ